MVGLLPAHIETDRAHELAAPTGDAADAVADVPLRRYGAPEEFGRVAAFLLSPAASYLTGAMVTIDGGTRAGFQSPTRASGRPASIVPGGQGQVGLDPDALASSDG